VNSFGLRRPPFVTEAEGNSEMAITLYKQLFDCLTLTDVTNYVRQINMVDYLDGVSIKYVI